MSSVTTTATTMSYRELQAALKPLKAAGKTTVKLNSKAEVLLAEYNKLTQQNVTKTPAKSEAKKAVAKKPANDGSTYTYRELQAMLKECKAEGVKLNVKLNASYDVLLAEYNRVA